MSLAPCADCGELVGNVHHCPGCDSNMHAFCGIGVGDEGYGQKRICENCAAPAATQIAAQVAEVAAPDAAAAAAAVAAAAATATPAAAAAVATAAAAAEKNRGGKLPTVAMMQLKPGLECPPTKPQNGDVRNEFTFTDGAGANIGKTICTCNHCQEVIQTSATINATRLKTHLSLCQVCPFEVKSRAYNSGQAVKKAARNGYLQSPSGKSLGEQPLQEVRAAMTAEFAMAGAMVSRTPKFHRISG